MDRLPRLWNGGTVAILGGGPSLQELDLSVLKGKRVIAINRAWEIWPEAEVLYAHDRGWWRQYHKQVEKLEALKITGAYVEDFMDARVLVKITRKDQPGFSTQQDVVYGIDSGAQAINASYLLGATRAILIAFDMQFVKGKSHWHSGYTNKVTEHDLQGRFLPWYQKSAKRILQHIEVINTSQVSKLDMFPKVALSQVDWGS